MSRLRTPASIVNSALRRRCSAYRRRQNLYAKNTEGLQRAVTVQRLVHNWVRPHVGLQQLPIKRTTRKSLKALLCKAFKDFLGLGLSAKRCR